MPTNRPKVLYRHARPDNAYMEKTNNVQDGIEMGVKKLRQLADEGNRMTGGKLSQLPSDAAELRILIWSFRHKIAERYRISS